jgi:hypothetical protein
LTVVETAGQGQNTLDTLEQPHLVLVEGSDDQAIVVAMVNHESLDGFHVHNMIGKDNWHGKIKAICNVIGFPKVTSLGLLRDADANGQSQFQSCVSALNAAGLPTPTGTGQLAAGPPAAAIEIVPSIDSSGALEELCLPSFDVGMRDCVDRYFECLENAEYAPKAYVQACLAGLRPHRKDLKVAALSGALDLTHETFDGLRGFLRGLHNI